MYWRYHSLASSNWYHFETVWLVRRSGAKVLIKFWVDYETRNRIVRLWHLLYHNCLKFYGLIPSMSVVIIQWSFFHLGQLFWSILPIKVLHYFMRPSWTFWILSNPIWGHLNKAQHTVKSLIQAAPIPKTWMCLVSSCSCLCPIRWCNVLSREWRCSWNSADRRCPNLIWVINNFIAY